MAGKSLMSCAAGFGVERENWDEPSGRVGAMTKFGRTFASPKHMPLVPSSIPAQPCSRRMKFECCYRGKCNLELRRQSEGSAISGTRSQI